MPIEFNVDPKLISKRDFYQLDYKITNLAFLIHNEFGRFWNEKIYQRELTRRCREAGFENVIAGLPILISYKGFQKCCYIDLLIDRAAVYELKTVNSLNGEHQRQILNYMFLLGLSHGKLINLRPSSVEYRFVSTTVTPQDRFQFIIDDAKWINLDAESEWLRKTIIELLKEWGAYLSTNLFYQAITFFRGGEENVVQNIKVLSGSEELGYQKMNLLTPKIAFQLSSINKNCAFYGHHLFRLLNHTNLEAIQWINFCRKRIEFRTIIKT
ncbi:MAG: GxxExxY protein [bacterium]|nr:GxxExxY protein [bacterium]